MSEKLRQLEDLLKPETKTTQVSQSAQILREILLRLNDVIWPSIIIDENNTLAAMEKAAKNGTGHLVVITHFGYGDAIKTFIEIVCRTPGIKETLVLAPQSLRQNREKTDKVARKIGAVLPPVLNKSTLETPEYQAFFEANPGALSEWQIKLGKQLIDQSIAVLKGGGTIFIAINAQRQSYLRMDDPQNPIAFFLFRMHEAGMTDFNIVTTALSIEKATSYVHHLVGQMNLTKTYKIIMGTSQNAAAVLETVREEDSQSGKPRINFKKIDALYRTELEALIPPEYKQPDTFSSVAVVGVGQTGQLLINQIREGIPSIGVEAVGKPNQAETIKTKLPKNVDCFGDLVTALETKPEAIIVALPNYALREALTTLKEKAHRPLTVILPSNGVDVIPLVAELGLLHDSGITIIRMGLFTISSLNKDGKAEYNAKKLRAGIAPVPREPSDQTPDQVVFSQDDHATFLKTDGLLRRSGFDTEFFADYQSMEWTKLVANCLGMTIPITGISYQETFEDPELLALEAQMMKDHLRCLRVMGIPFAKIPWEMISLLKFVRFAPTSVLEKLRKPLAQKVSHGREGKLPANARKLENHQPTEIREYLLPFVRAARENGFSCVVDEAILALLDEHEAGLSSGKFDLTSLDQKDRKNLLLSKYQQLKVT